ncbi:MAG: DUF3990 domain-containing protein [Acholeplasmataceae bacterium]|nr:DUF3990 domain-containing protein [Acholeplasmataceae bacterium]
MIIYHGSKNIIEKPIFKKGNIYNDYGLGFYCTESLELAKEWACTDFEASCYANKYEIDESKYKVLDLTKYSILNWMAILLKFRSFAINTVVGTEAKEFLINNYYIDVDKYDIIIGYRADDSYFSFAKDFINNVISIKQLEEAMYLGELGIQIVLKSKDAFDNIKYLGSDTVNPVEYYDKRMKRDETARKYYTNNTKKIDSNDLFIMDIIRRGGKDVN